MTENSRLLVALSNDRARERLVGQLLADGFALEAAAAPRETRLKAAGRPDLLVLGALEEPTGALRLLRELRAGEGRPAPDPALPVLVLLADGGQLSVLRAFEAGADDALRAPLSYLELRARVRALLRRSLMPLTPAPRRVGDLVIDPRAREASYAGRLLCLARMEFELLLQLASEPARVFAKAELLREVWGYRTQGRTRTLDAHACRLRRKLEQAGATGHVVNVHGYGYRLLAPSEPAAVAARNGRHPLELVDGR